MTQSAFSKLADLNERMKNIFVIFNIPIINAKV